MSTPYRESPSALLEVRGLVTAFHTDEGSSRAVDDVSFEVARGRTLGIVGESGCGKSVTSLSIMRLVPDPPGRIEAGEIRFEGRDLLRLEEREMRALRGNEIAMIFQEPMTSLNPVYRVGDQVGEALRRHRGMSKAEARVRAVELLRKVGIPAPEQRVHDYPHSLSGGMRQRVMIAMALACGPKLLIADEPTTALDVTIQAQILRLLRDLQRETEMSMVLITHDLGVVAEAADDVVVMYAGKVVERAPTRALFADPRHPYTRGLLGSLPGVHRATEGASAKRADGTRRKLATIPGVVPDLRSIPAGCRFRARCDVAIARCAEREPELVGASHAVACFVAQGDTAAVAGAAPQAEARP